MLNTLPVMPVGQSPRAIVKVAGVIVPGWIRWSVDNNTLYQADTFRVEFAIQALPPETDARWFSEQDEAFVEIFAGYPDDVSNFSETDLDSLTYGRTDDIDFDPVSGTITLTGRDLTAAFIDSKVTTQFQNMTSSQIAEKLALSHGMSYSGPPTKTAVGGFYAYDRVRMSHQRSEWDILTWLAQQEGFNCYVKGKTLYFEPRPTQKADFYELRWTVNENGNPSANAIDVNLSRSLTVAKGVTVIVQSWHLRPANSITAYYPGRGKTTQPGKASPFGDQQIYTIERGNLDQERANKLAQQLHLEITQHEMKMRARLPADNVLTQTALLRLSGTGTKWDQDYYVDGLRRYMSVDEGYVMDVSAKNHNPESSPAI